MPLPKGFELEPSVPAGFELETEAPVEQEESFLGGVKRRLSSVSSLADPETWKQAGRELTSFPDIQGRAGPEIMKQIEGLAKDVVIMAPTSAMSQAARLMGKPAKTAAAKVKEAALLQTAKAGYTVPKSNIKSTMETNILERFGGKQAIEHTASTKSQALTNAKAARGLGLADDALITPESLDALRTGAGKAYEAVKIGGTANADKVFFNTLDDIAKKTSGASKAFPKASNKQMKQFTDTFKEKVIDIDGALDQVRILRAASSKSYASMAPADKMMGKAQRKVADAIDDFIERSISDKAPTGAFKNYVDARKLIAMSHTVEDMLKGGNVDAIKFGQLLKKKPGLLTGEFKEIAQFGLNHPNIARIRSGQAPSGGLFEPLVYGGLGGAAYGDPTGTLAAAIPIIGKPIARHLATKVPQAAKPSRGVLERIQKPLPGLGVALDRTNRDNRNR